MNIIDMQNTSQVEMYSFINIPMATRGQPRLGFMRTFWDDAMNKNIQKY